MNHAVAVELANRTGRSPRLRKDDIDNVRAHSVLLGDTSSPFTTLVGFIQPKRAFAKVDSHWLFAGYGLRSTDFVREAQRKARREKAAQLGHSVLSTFWRMIARRKLSYSFTLGSAWKHSEACSSARSYSPISNKTFANSYRQAVRCG